MLDWYCSNCNKEEETEEEPFVTIYETLHRRLWNWLAEDEYREKGDWPEWDINGGNLDSSIPAYCFACEEAETRAELDSSDYRCDYCPIDWYRHGVKQLRDQILEDCPCVRGEYGYWIGNPRSENRKVLAKIIAEAEWH